MPETGARCKRCRLAQHRRPTVRHHGADAAPRDPADALARPAVRGPRVQPRPGRPAAADLPRDHRRVRGRGADDRLPGRDRRVRRGHGPAQLRRADPGRVAAAAAGHRRDPVRWWVRGDGVRDELPDLRDPQRRVAHRRLAAAPGRQRPAGRAVPARTTRLRDQRPHRRWQRRDGRRRRDRRPTDRRRRLARCLDRVRACRPSSSRSRSSCSCASSARTARRPRPAGPSAPPSGGSAPTATCCGCT